MSAFDENASVQACEVERLLLKHMRLPWLEFALGSRVVRGSGFLTRWSEGQWSEKLVVDSVMATRRYFALPYGPNGVAPSDNVRESEPYFERLEKAGLGQVKRPDLLILRAADRAAAQHLVEQLGGTLELPFTKEDDRRMRHLLSLAIAAVECENSLWVAKNMPDFGKPLRPMARLGGNPGLPKGAVIPTVILKEEDRAPLRAWQRANGVPIHIWHVFYDLAYGLALDTAEALIAGGSVEPREQVYQAPGGAITKKALYRIAYHHAYHLGDVVVGPTLMAAHIMDRNGHVLPYVRFTGGKLRLAPEALETLALRGRQQ